MAANWVVQEKYLVPIPASDSQINNQNINVYNDEKSASN